MRICSEMEEHSYFVSPRIYDIELRRRHFTNLYTILSEGAQMLVETTPIKVTLKRKRNLLEILNIST